MSIKASAIVLPSGGHYMSAADTLSFIGDTIPATYYNGSEYVDINFTYFSNFTMGSSGNVFSEQSENPVSYMTINGTPYLRYNATLSGVSLDPNYITCHFEPHYSIFNTDWLYTGFALSCNGSSPSSSVYQSPQANWYLGGTIHNFYNSSDSTSSSGVKAYLQGGSSYNNSRFTYVPIFNTSVSAFSAYCQDVSFYGNSYSYIASYILLVMCPYVSGDASGASGTFATSGTDSGGTDINVNVDVDLTETNGLLGSIISGISGIGDSIKGLFVPDQEDIVDFKEDVADILTDSFSGYSETQELLDDVRDVLISSNPSAVLEFPAISIPGTSFATSAKSINLNFDNDIIDWVKWIIDIMATIAVVNMIQNKIKAVLVGESVVEVEEIDG